MIALDLFAGTGWGMTERPFVTASNAVGRAEGTGGSGGKAAVTREKDRGAWRSWHEADRAADSRDEGLRGPWGMTERPYPTVASGTERGGGTDPLALGGSGARKIVTSERERGAWVDERPATTIAGDSRVWPPGHKVNAADRARRADANERYGDRAGTHAERVTIAEAAALQSYPPGFVWCGTKTKAFLQIGNAVPPLLAEAILREVTL